MCRELLSITYFFPQSYALFALFSYLILLLITLLDLKVHHITKFRIGLIDFKPADEEPWYGEFIEIGFHNGSKYHCGVENYDAISDTLLLKPTCKLEI